jgi:hypothetical protein
VSRLRDRLPPPLLGELAEAIELEATFCFGQCRKLSPIVLCEPDEEFCHERKRFLSRYLVEREAYRRGESVSRARALNLGMRHFKPNGPQKPFLFK